MTKNGYADKLKEFVRAGGIFITTYFSGIVDEHDLVISGGYPGELKDLLGIWVEENDALPEGEQNAFTYQGRDYCAKIICDLLHLEGAESLAVYEKDFYQGMPVLTRNKYGEGQAYYIGSRSTPDFYSYFMGNILREAGVMPLLSTPEGVEAAARDNGKGRTLFLLNHNADRSKVVLENDCTDAVSGKYYKAGGTLEIEAGGVLILKQEK